MYLSIDEIIELIPPIGWFLDENQMIRRKSPFSSVLQCPITAALGIDGVSIPTHDSRLNPILAHEIVFASDNRRGRPEFSLSLRDRLLRATRPKGWTPSCDYLSLTECKKTAIYWVEWSSGSTRVYCPIHKEGNLGVQHGFLGGVTVPPPETIMCCGPGFNRFKRLCPTSSPAIGFKDWPRSPRPIIGGTIQSYCAPCKNEYSKSSTLTPLNAHLLKDAQGIQAMTLPTNVSSSSNSNKETSKMAMMPVNDKLTKVDPTQSDDKTTFYVRGTEKGHFYVVTNALKGGERTGVVGFRPLNVNFAALTDIPSGYTYATSDVRVRVVPVGPITPNLTALLESHGFSVREGNSSQPHFSQVVKGAQAAQTIANAKLDLSIAG